MSSRVAESTDGAPPTMIAETTREGVLPVAWTAVRAP
jgi:hypothetical protein